MGRSTRRVVLCAREFGSVPDRPDIAAGPGLFRHGIPRAWRVHDPDRSIGVGNLVGAEAWRAALLAGVEATATRGWVVEWVPDPDILDAFAGDAVVVPDARALADLPMAPEPRRAATGPAPELVLVVGAARSGTTWLQHLLLDHPDIAGPRTETFLFHALGDSRAVGPAAIPFVQSVVDEVVRTYHARVAPRATHVVEKTPLHVYDLDLVEGALPKTRVIHIVRDGRDVATSMSTADIWTDMTPRRAAEVWCECLDLVRGSGLDVLEVRYEDLSAGPRRVMVSVLEWLGVAADEATLDVTLRNVSERVSHHGPAAPLGVPRWTTLDPRSRRAVFRTEARHLVRLGYASPAEVASGALGVRPARRGPRDRSRTP